jgi:hypothetical protein
MKTHLVLAFIVASHLLTQGFSQVAAPTSDGAVPWGQPVEGVSVRLRTDKARWPSNEILRFRLDVRNEGQREFHTVRSQEPGRLQVDGIWYDWIGAFDLKVSPLPPKREYRDIAVSLGGNWKAKQEWRDKTKAPPPLIPLQLPPGKHTVRFAPEIRDITVKPKPRNNYVPSNPVEIEIWSNLKSPAERSSERGFAPSLSFDVKRAEATRVAGVRGVRAWPSGLGCHPGWRA